MSNKKAILKLEQGGKILEAGTSFDDFKAYEIEGLSGLEFDFSMTPTPQSPNTIINNKKPLPREITIHINCNGGQRQFLNRFFNPYIKGKLTVTWGDARRWIEYYCHPVKIIQETVYRSLRVEILLVCPSPYWKDMDDYGKNIASRMKLLAFPFVMQKKTGLIADYRIFSTEVSIQNNGDVDVGAKIIFTALGNVKNPKLTLNGGQFVRAVVDMAKGDEVVFSTDIDDLYVTMNGEDILNNTDPAMSFFQIPIGENIITYSSDEGTANMQVTVFYTPQYINI